MPRPPKTKPRYRVRIKDHLQIRAGDLIPNPHNWRSHPPEQRDAMRAVLEEIGYVDELKVVKARTGYMLIDGHLRADLDPEDLVPIAVLDLKADEALKMLGTFDAITAMAERDEDQWINLLGSFDSQHVEFEALIKRFAGLDGYDGAGGNGAGGQEGEGARLTLAERFVVPPFSVLDARQGYWQERKRAWIALGIASHEGRADNLLSMSDTVLNAGKKARAINDHEWQAKTLGKVQAPRVRKQSASLRGGLTYGTSSHPYDGTDPETEASYTGTSIFDPVLAELAYRWFSPPDARVLDPFAGGSVRGIVASYLGRSYDGVDLSAEQIAANVAQLSSLRASGEGTRISWHEGDSRDISAIAPGEYDFVFSCPPYFDLERYSEDERDLSNASWEQFIEAYEAIVAASCAMLRNNRFAAFVVGDVRDKAGIYRNFLGATIEAFEKAGLLYYNEAILVTAVASLPIRVGRMFEASRKLGKTHQQLLIFVKGSPKVATEDCGAVEYGDPAELFGALVEADSGGVPSSAD